MIYTTVDNFYLSDEQLENSPSRIDGIEEATETSLRMYGCDLIQRRWNFAEMATAQVLFHRFLCKKSLARFHVKTVAASCVWLASKLEETPKKVRQVIIVFHRMECRKKKKNLDLCSKEFLELKMEVSRIERHVLKEMGFVCHVEHPYKSETGNEFNAVVKAKEDSRVIMTENVVGSTGEKIVTRIEKKSKMEVIAPIAE